MKDTSIGEKPLGPSPLVSLEALRRALNGVPHNSSKTATISNTMSSMSKLNSTMTGLNGTHIGMRICDCFQHMCPTGLVFCFVYQADINIKLI